MRFPSFAALTAIVLASTIATSASAASPAQKPNPSAHPQTITPPSPAQTSNNFAIDLLGLQAAPGTVDPAIGLAALYLRGTVVPDPIAAAAWLKVAADRGDVKAAWALAEMNVRGIGISRDPKEAARLLAQIDATDPLPPDLAQKIDGLRAELDIPKAVPRIAVASSPLPPPETIPAPPAPTLPTANLQQPDANKPSLIVAGPSQSDEPSRRKSETEPPQKPSAIEDSPPTPPTPVPTATPIPSPSRPALAVAPEATVPAQVPIPSTAPTVPATIGAVTIAIADGNDPIDLQDLWKDLSSRHRSELGAISERIGSTKDAKGRPLYRLELTGIASSTDAKRLCTVLSTPHCQILATTQEAAPAAISSTTHNPITGPVGTQAPQATASGTTYPADQLVQPVSAMRPEARYAAILGYAQNEEYARESIAAFSARLGDALGKKRFINAEKAQIGSPEPWVIFADGYADPNEAAQLCAAARNKTPQCTPARHN